MTKRATKYPGISEIGPGKYYIRAYNPNGPEHRETFAGGIRAAVDRRTELLAQLSTGGAVDRKESRKLFATYAAEYVASAPLKHSSQIRYHRVLERYINPVLGQVPIGRLRHSHVRALQTSLQRMRLAPSTTALTLTVARIVTTAAHRDGLVGRDPFVGVKLPKVAKRRVKHVPSMVEILTAADCRGQLRPALLVLAGTGLRASELAGVALEDVDFLRRTLHVRRQVLFDPGTRTCYVDTPKSLDGERSIPLPDFVVDALAAWLAQRPARTLTLPVGEPGAEETVTLTLVFTAERSDGALTRDSLRHRVATRSRLNGAEQFSPHALRHRYTTTLHDAGVPLRAIDYVTGHAPTGVSLAVYTEVTTLALEAARAAIQAAFDDAMTQISRKSDEAAVL